MHHIYRITQCNWQGRQNAAKGVNDIAVDSELRRTNSWNLGNPLNQRILLYSINDRWKVIH